MVSLPHVAFKLVFINQIERAALQAVRGDQSSTEASPIYMHRILLLPTGPRSHLEGRD